MQVSVETGEGAQRTLKVQVPAETIDQEVDNRIKQMSGRVKIDGFRPGKVPLKVVKQRYGDQVFAEVATEVLQRTFQEAITNENLNMVGDPVFTPQKMEAGQPLEYTATFDVIESVDLVDMSTISVEKIEAAVTDADVDNMIETLRKQRMSWTDSDVSADGDKVTIDFVGKIDGEAFDGGTAENVPVVIGSGSMIPGFEDGLKGLKKDDTSTFKADFPEDYHAKDLAGKEAEFDITVKGVESPVLPEVDEEFAKLFGIDDGDIDKLKTEIRNNMQRELDNRLKIDVNNKLMDELAAKHQVNVPQSIVQSEVEALRKQAQENGQSNVDESQLEQDANKRVKLGIIVNEIIKQAGLSVTAEMVEERLDQMSRDYEDSEEFKNHYKMNPELKRSIESMLIEESVVDWAMKDAKVSTVSKSFDEVVRVQ